MQWSNRIAIAAKGSLCELSSCKNLKLDCLGCWRPHNGRETSVNSSSRSAVDSPLNVGNTSLLSINFAPITCTTPRLKGLHFNRRFQDKIDLVENLQAELDMIRVSSDKQCADLTELQGELMKTSKELKSAGTKNDDISHQLEAALADCKVSFIGYHRNMSGRAVSLTYDSHSQRMADCMLGQRRVDGTVGIKLSEASKSGFSGEDVSVDSASQAGRIVYVQTLLEGGSAIKSNRSPSLSLPITSCMRILRV